MVAADQYRCNRRRRDDSSLGPEPKTTRSLLPCFADLSGAGPAGSPRSFSSNSISAKGAPKSYGPSEAIHSPAHLAAEAIGRESEGTEPRADAEPLFRPAGLNLDEVT